MSRAVDVDEAPVPAECREETLDILRRVVGRVVAGETVGVLIIEIPAAGMPDTLWSFADARVGDAVLGARILDSELMSLVRSVRDGTYEGEE